MMSFHESSRRIARWPFFALASIATLFCACRPTAIRRLVVAVIVWIAVDGVLWRGSAAHVLQECDVAILPSFADGNSASAIIREAGEIGIETSLQHHSPATIFRRAVVGMSGITVRYSSRPICFSVHAPATSVVPRTHQISPYDFCFTAIALTQDTPSRSTISMANWIGDLQDDKPTEAFPDHGIGGNSSHSLWHGFHPCLGQSRLSCLPSSAARCVGA